MPSGLALPYIEFFNTQNSMFFEQKNSKESKLACVYPNKQNALKPCPSLH
jgi:hypothetical protein